MKELIFALQQGLALTSEPYAQLGSQYGLRGDDVLEALAKYRAEGLVRRVGAVFNVSQLGYQSALCAVLVSPERLEAVSTSLIPHPGITHCYSRITSDTNLPNLWFTLSTLAADFQRELMILQSKFPEVIRILPATRKFKVQVVLDPAQLSVLAAPELDAEVPVIGTQRVETSDLDRALIRLLHEEFPACAQPFAEIASKLSMRESEVLAKLQEWKAVGVLRRIGVLIKHQKLGFTANAMCTWEVPAHQIEAVGTKLAARREITHCYERSTFPGFPYNVFVMIHSGSEADLHQLAQSLSAQIQIPLGRMFISAREFKKSSLVPFQEC